MKSPFFAWFIGFVPAMVVGILLAMSGPLGLKALLLSALLAGPAGLGLSIASALSSDCCGARGHLLMHLAGICGGLFGAAAGLVFLAYCVLIGAGGPWILAAAVILACASAVLLTILPAMVTYALRRWYEERRDAR